MNLEALDMAVNPFLGKIPGRSPELVTEMDFEQDELIEQILKQYRCIKFLDDWTTTIASISILELDVLTPKQIDVVLQRMIRYEERPVSGITGLFVSKLVQDSYDRGYNDFVLTTGNLGIDRIGWNLKGSLERKLEIKIKGHVGYGCGYNAECSSVLVEGNAGDICGSNSVSSTIHVRGNTGYSCGSRSESSLFIVEGSVGRECGNESQYSIFLITGDTDWWCGKSSESSLFFVKGSTGSCCGSYAKKSFFDIQGSVEDDCGSRSNQSLFTIKNEVGHNCGRESYSSVFVADGMVSNGWGEDSENSTFITSNKATYKKMKEMISEGRLIYKPK